MTKFNPKNKKVLTYEDCLAPAMEITDAEDAHQYFNAYLEWQTKNMQEATGKHSPEEICKINLGYYAGYYNEETRERVERLFNCSHPIFGSIKLNGSPTTEKALSMGMQAGADSKKN